MKAGYWREHNGKDFFIPCRLVRQFDDLYLMMDEAVAHNDNKEYEKFYDEVDSKFDEYVILSFKKLYLTLHPIMVCDPVGITESEEKSHDEYNF